MENNCRIVVSNNESKQTHLIYGHKIALVDELLSGEYGFLVQLLCLTYEEKETLCMPTYVSQQTVWGYDFAYVIFPEKETRIITQECDIKHNIHYDVKKVMDNIVNRLLLSISPGMRDIYMDLININTKGDFRQIVKAYLYSHKFFPSLTTFFLVDNYSDQSIIIPRNDKEAEKFNNECEKSNDYLYNTLKYQINKKKEMNDALFTHITIIGIENQLMLSAYNNIFLEQAGRIGISSINAPNELCRHYHDIFPKSREWEREVMHPWLFTDILLNTPINKCYNCNSDNKNLKVCSRCSWAKLCSNCNQHNFCDHLITCHMKLKPQ